MELRTRNIHMDCVRVKASSQITIEDDVNIPDSKPDVESILLTCGNIIVEDTKALTNQVSVRGKLDFSMLYVSEEEDRSPAGMTGTIPMNELINLDQVSAGDNLVTDVKIEDLTIIMINSRKISVRCLAMITVRADCMTDIRIPIAVEGGESTECHMVNHDYRETVVMKKDLIRVKDLITLPKNDPNIGCILWQEANVTWIDYRCQNDAIRIQGELDEFLLYRSDDEDHSLHFYENTYSFNQTLECSGVREGMIPVIDHRGAGTQVTMEKDEDGENRCVAIDIPMELDIRVYEENGYPVLEDIYAVDRRIDTVTAEKEYRCVRSRNVVKQRMAERIQLAEENPAILQLLRCRGEITIDNTAVTPEGIEVHGNIAICILYLGGEEEGGYHVRKQDLPVDYVIDLPNLPNDSCYTVEPSVEQISAIPADSRQVDVKLILSFRTTVYRKEKVCLIESLNVDEKTDVADDLPGMALYVVKPGDTLWKIGKRYYVSIESLKENNQLTDDVIQPGMKLLVVR